MPSAERLIASSREVPFIGSGGPTSTASVGRAVLVDTSSSNIQSSAVKNQRSCTGSALPSLEVQRTTSHGKANSRLRVFTGLTTPGWLSSFLTKSLAAELAVVRVRRDLSG